MLYSLLLFPINNILILDWLFVLEHLFFSNLALSDGHVDIHYMNWRIDKLGLYHTWFFCSFHSFVLKHIMHVIVCRTIYSLMSNLTIDMIGIPHRSLYFNLLSNNFINCRNILFLSFLTLHVSTLWFVQWQFVQYIHVFKIILWGCWSSIVLLLCGTNKLFIASTSKIPFSKTKIASLCCCRGFFFHACCCYMLTWL
jgi:hypothetical protein